jgi:hypothetical protein
MFGIACIRDIGNHIHPGFVKAIPLGTTDLWVGNGNHIAGIDELGGFQVIPFKIAQAFLFGRSELVFQLICYGRN